MKHDDICVPPLKVAQRSSPGSPRVPGPPPVGQYTSPVEDHGLRRGQETRQLTLTITILILDHKLTLTEKKGKQKNIQITWVIGNFSRESSYLIKDFLKVDCQ